MTLRSIGYACLASLLIAMTIDAVRCAWIFYNDTGTEPALMVVRNRTFSHKGVEYVGVIPSRPYHMNGVAEEIYNWDGSWWTTKEYAKARERAYNSSLGLSFIGKVTMEITFSRDLKP